MSNQAAALAAVIDGPGRQLLETLPPWQPSEGQQIAEGLRKRGVDPHLVSSVMNQRQLRYEAVGKLGEIAADLFFTRDGLEQATRLVVAALHAQRFAAAGISHVADLGCGIGIDSYALAGMGMRVSAVDLDPARQQAARENLRFFPDARVFREDVTTLEFGRLGIGLQDGIFADPARRRDGRRLLNPADWSPPLALVFDWARAVKGLGVKVAPGIDHGLLPTQWQAQFTSVDGDLVEAAFWSPALREAWSDPCAERLAHIIYRGEHHVLAAAGQDPEVGPPQQWIIDPDAAIIRSGALGSLARICNAHTLHPRIAYLSAPAPAPAWAGSSFRIIDNVPLKPAAIAAALVAAGADAQTPLEVKKRGAQIDPAVLRKQLRAHKTLKRAKASHARELVVIATRVQQAHRALIATR